MQAVIEAILEPGTGYKVVPFVNATIAVLLVVLVASAINWSHTDIAVHFWAMSVIAVLLLVTVNWFAAELKKAKKTK